MQDSDQLAGLHQEIARLNRQIHDVSKEQARLDGIMRQPQNASVLEWSVLINTLIYQKAISWSRLFADLEKTLPYDVKVVAHPSAIDSLNHVRLDMTLGSDKPDSVFRRHARPGRLGCVRNGQADFEPPPTQAEPLYRFRFTVNYAQKL